MSTTDPMSTTYPHPASGAPTGSTPGGDPSGGSRRTAWIIAGAAALVGTVGGTALGISRSGGDTPTATVTPSSSVAATTPATSKPASSSATPSVAATLSNPAELDAAAGAAILTSAGLKVTGKPELAWQWTDGNGRNVVVATRQVTHTRADGTVDAAIVRVVQAAHLETKATVLRTLFDPGAVSDAKAKTCDLDFALDFVPGSVVVTDADKDGFGEVTIGWWSQCRSDPGPASIKLALLENGRYYILRGQGLRAADRKALTPDLAKLIPAATFQPDPSSSHWPKGTYAPTVALFKQLYA